MLFVFSVEVSFSLHSLEEIALDFKYCCPSPSLPARQHYSPEDIGKAVNLEGEENERNGSSEAETVTTCVAVVLLPAAEGLTNFLPGFLHCLSTLLDGNQEKEGRLFVTKLSKGRGTRVPSENISSKPMKVILWQHHLSASIRGRLFIQMLKNCF